MPEHAVKGIPLLQARNQWSFHRESLRSVRPPHMGQEARLPLARTRCRGISMGERSHIPWSRRGTRSWRSWGGSSGSSSTTAEPASPQARSLRTQRWGSCCACRASRLLQGHAVLSLGCQFAARMEVRGQLSLVTSPLGEFVPSPSSLCHSEGTGRTGERSFCRDAPVLQKTPSCRRTSAPSPEMCCFH